MKTHNRFLPTGTSLAAIFGLVLVSLSSPNVFAATEPKPPATTNSLPTIEIVESSFIIPSSASQGRDPFYPLSERLVKTVKATNNAPVKTMPVTLVLKGVSGSDTKRYALINDKTFVAGEEREISTGTSRVRVHCIEIREDSVTVEVDGASKVLRLRPGL